MAEIYPSSMYADDTKLEHGTKPPEIQVMVNNNQ